MTAGRRREPRLGRRPGVPALAAVAVLLATGTAGAAVHALRDAPSTPASGASSGSAPDRAVAVPEAAPPAQPTLVRGPRIVFRHTGLDERYGLVAMVPLAHPRGPRAFTAVACDRVYATQEEASCLQTRRGVRTQYALEELDAHWAVRSTVALPGIPSRTRISPDGSLVATTTFVTGHSYRQTGFSAETEIRAFGGRSLGNLEDFTLVIDGRTVTPADRNVWGVTFVDDHEFYATAATAGRTYLVRGDLDRRTLTALHRNAECPSVSPDGSAVAYKVVRPGGDHRWSVAVLDLATGRQTVLPNDGASIDDQVEWLDDHTLLYGLARPDQAGVSDVWAVDVSGRTPPRLFLERAWSPSVVRSARARAHDR